MYNQELLVLYLLLHQYFNVFKIKTDVTGIETIDAYGSKLDSGLDNAIKITLDEIGRSIVDEAQRLVPVRTGKLRQSIRIKSVRVTSRGGELEGGAYIKYARYVEYGTSKQRARNYLTNAFREGINNGTQKLASNVKSAIGSTQFTLFKY